MKNKKGFTLIEIIVVLVIIAILAAVAVPSLIGMVEDARGKAYANDAHIGLTAAQAAVTEAVGSGLYTIYTAGGVSKFSTSVTTAPLKGLLITEHPTFINMTKDKELGLFVDAKVIDNQVVGITYYSHGGTAASPANTGYKIVVFNGATTVTKLPETTT